MALKRFVIGDGPEEFAPDDKVVETYPAPDGGGGKWVVVERDVPDAPDYYPSVVGTAMVRNEYMVEQEHHGVWIKRATGLLFMAFETKKNQRGLWPEKHVVNFVPDPSPLEQVADVSKKLDDARQDLRREKRKTASAEEALRNLVADIRQIQSAFDSKGALTDLSKWAMATSAGANLLDWLRRKL